MFFLCLHVTDAQQTTRRARSPALTAGEGHDVDYKLVGDPGLALERFGVWEYDNVILFAPSAPSENLPARRVSTPGAALLQRMTTGENCFVDDRRKFGTTQNATAARATQSFVCCESYNVCKWHRVWMCATRNESSNMCDIKHHVCANFIGDFFKWFWLKSAWIRSCASNN